MERESDKRSERVEEEIEGLERVWDRGGVLEPGIRRDWGLGLGCQLSSAVNNVTGRSRWTTDMVGHT